MKSAYQVTDLVPHSGKMSLLSRILGYGEGWLHAEVDISGESMFADERGVPAWIGMEYMAQTIAAYAGLQERNKGGVPKIGLLLGSRNYSSSVDYFARGQTLRIEVELEIVAANGLNVFNCELTGNETRAVAVVNVFQPENAEKFLEEALA